MRFDNQVGSGFSQGDVRTGAFGADYSFASVITGIAVSYSQGTGDFELGRAGKDDVGEVSTTLTSAFPYARLAISERIHAWGVLGYGAGTLNVEGGGEQDPEGDIAMRMVGMGLKGEILPSGDARAFRLRVRSDALVASMQSDAVEGRSELEADVSRIRLGLEAVKGFELGPGTTLRPELRAGLRYDGGVVETGFGLEVGGGVAVTAMNQGLVVSIHGRSLVTHEQSGYDEWGFGGGITVNPGGQGRGLSLDLRPTWGSTSSGVARLWAQGAAGMTGDVYAGRRMNAEVGYGVGAPGGRGILMPYARIVVAPKSGPRYPGMGGTASPLAPASLQAAGRDAYGYQLGGRLMLSDGLSANLEAGRSAWSPYAGPERNARVSLALTW